MGEKIRRQLFNIPPPTQLPNSQIILPHVFLGDEAFPLLTNLMKTYPRMQSLTDNEKAIYNYRHSRARRIVENAFGIMAETFRVFHTPIAMSVDAIDNLIISSCIIHNLLIDHRVLNTNRENVPEMPEENLHPLNNIVEHEFEENLRNIEIRNSFKQYFNNEGAVQWQNRMAGI